MVLNELRRTFEKRRLNLINILETDGSELDLGKQHQLFGAIKEIENFLRTLDNMRDVEVSDNMNFRLRNDTDKGLFNRLPKLKK